MTKEEFFADHDQSLLAAISHATVGIAGAGGLGSNAAAALAQRLADPRGEREVAADGAQVEKDADAQHGLGVRHARPVREMLQPAGQGPTPFVGGRHDLAGAVGIAAGIEAVADELRELPEIFIGPGRCIVGVDCRLRFRRNWG